jgi:hypothetical protein
VPAAVDYCYSRAVEPGTGGYVPSAQTLGCRVGVAQLCELVNCVTVVSGIFVMEFALDAPSNNN